MGEHELLLTIYAFCIWHILVPYLKNILLFTLDKTRKIIVKWSKSCNELRTLNFDIEKMIESEFNKEEDYKQFLLIIYVIEIQNFINKYQQN